MDLEQLQKEKQDLEQQLLERNKVRVLFISALYISALPCPCARNYSVPSERFADAPWAPPGEIFFPGFPLLFPSAFLSSFHTPSLLPCLPRETMSRGSALEQQQI